MMRGIASQLRDNGYPAKVRDNGIVILGRGRYVIVAEGDRGYYWRNESGMLSDGFTCDLYLSDGEEITNHLCNLLDEEPR